MRKSRFKSARRSNRRLSTLALANVVVMAGAGQAADTDAAPNSSATTTTSSGTKTAPAPSGRANTSSGKPTTKSPSSLGPASDATLDEVVVSAKPEGAYQTESSANGKYTEPLRDTPQTVTVIPQQLMKDQHATTLKQALQNVPGVTFGAGEGGTLAGDNITIRGFNARDDIFVDGFRDTGVYNRDPFNLEQVEVTKGPASAYGGHGTTGGSVNLITKAPSLDAFYDFDTSYGNNQYYRETLDINQPLGVVPHAAIRLNAIYQYNQYADRNFIYDSRWGANPTLAFGLGTDTQATLSYFFLKEHDLPAFGLPVVNANAIASNPSLAPYNGKVAPVDYSNFYGFLNHDYEDSTTHIPDIKITHDFDNDLKFQNDTRYEYTLRRSIETSPRFDAISATSPLAVPPYTTPPLTSGLLPPDTMTRELKNRHQVDTLLGNQTEITANFDIFKMSNTLVATAEFSEERENARTFNGTNTADSLSNPTPYDSYPFPTESFGPEVHATVDDAALSVFDDLKITKQWILSGGVRYDHVYSQSRTDANSTTNAPGFGFSRVDDLPSWRMALAYKPVEYGTFYFGYGTSFNPSIEGTASDAASPDTLTASTANLAPEKDESFELGTKWDVLNEKLSLTAALFRTNKTNARVTDPSAPAGSGTIILGGEDRVQGIEFGATGELMKEWKVYGGYTLMQSKILSGPSTAFPGNQLPNTPQQSASLWTTYELPMHVTLGAGAVFVDQRYGSVANTSSADGYVTEQLMGGYRINKNLSVQVNVYNLSNEHYIEAVGSNFTPGAGRSVVGSAELKF